MVGWMANVMVIQTTRFVNITKDRGAEFLEKTKTKKNKKVSSRSRDEYARTQLIN